MEYDYQRGFPLKSIGDWVHALHFTWSNIAPFVKHVQNAIITSVHRQHDYVLAHH